MIEVFFTVPSRWLPKHALLLLLPLLMSVIAITTASCVHALHKEYRC
jgi:hypothetical protein